MRILIVCLGNICRSPTAEAVFRAKAPEWHIDSAGTGAWHIGEPPHPPMIAAGRRAGYDLSPCRARKVTAADFEAFDVILAADPSNLDDLEVLRPAGNTTPVRLFAPYAGSGEREIPDPYYTGDFDGAFELVERAVDGFLAQEQ